MVLLEFSKVSKAYPQSSFSLKNLSFQVKKNEILGIVGRNGTGKSTLLKMMNALVSVDSGHIYYKGQNIQTQDEKFLRQLRKKVVYIFQKAQLLENETVEYHLKLVYWLDGKKIQTEAIQSMLEFMGLTHLRKMPCKHLSGGQQQKLAIAMALLQEPDVLLCDEMTSALDVQSEQEIFELLLKVKAEKKLTLVMISHNLTLLKHLCERVMFIENHTLQAIFYPQCKGKPPSESDYASMVKEMLMHD